ncbi:tensin-2-like isoform X4 [Labeo rohita]|uniref:Tensin-2-like isoform X4 n=1 Tax=Labeo rohita TaxID=84645 RepID=A0A498LS27_LABRO|nr:tensin-2-like isoform X4 [Labeo rohita]
MSCCTRKESQRPDIQRRVQAGKGEPHVFKEKTFKKKRQCGVCRQSVENLGSFCRVCKTATHKKCEAKACQSAMCRIWSCQKTAGPIQSLSVVLL